MLKRWWIVVVLLLGLFVNLSCNRMKVTTNPALPEQTLMPVQKNMPSITSTASTLVPLLSIDNDLIHWQTYHETTNLFTVDYPQDWQITAPSSLSGSGQVWQISSPTQTVTIGQHMTRIGEEISLEAWVAQSENYEFEFQRIESQPLLLSNLDAYTIHDQIESPIRDAYVTYIRCLGQVWFVHTIDLDVNSKRLETVYENIVSTFKPTCSH